MKQTKIFDAVDRANELGFSSYDELIIGFSRMVVQKLKLTGLNIQAEKMKLWNKAIYEQAEPAAAYINGGRWLAKCPVCSNIEHVTPLHPYLFCHECTNEDIRQAARPVLFPQSEEIKKIEEALLKNDLFLPDELGKLYKDINTTDLARLAQPAPGYSRLDWSFS